MSETPPRPTRLVGLALVAIGAVELIGLITGPLVTGEAQFGISVLALPAGLALYFGRTGWVRPALRLLQVGAVGVAVASLLALFGAVPVDVTFGDRAAELAGGQRALVAVLTVLQAALWVGVLDLAGRLVLAPEPPKATVAAAA